MGIFADEVRQAQDASLDDMVERAALVIREDVLSAAKKGEKKLDSRYLVGLNWAFTELSIRTAINNIVAEDHEFFYTEDFLTLYWR